MMSNRHSYGEMQLKDMYMQSPIVRVVLRNTMHDLGLKEETTEL